MDRLLYTALFALFAGFLTAVVSFVKLVNDKEAKISDFREQWTNSVRATLADFISKVTTICAILEERCYRAEQYNNVLQQTASNVDDNEKKTLAEVIIYDRAMLEKTNEARRLLFSEINSANNLARLHFKMNDPDFLGIENKIDSILDLLRDAESEDVVISEKRVKEITARISVITADISTLSRLAIKNEWEKVKKGEPVYIKTQRVAKWSVVIFFFVFITVGIHALLSTHNHSVDINNQNIKPSIVIECKTREHITSSKCEESKAHE